ncbi:hypothetical protein KZZ52_36185 [Dactylosporangium sp. AC04546]|uniref:hypothetical protein n=1 Tax=Dactylosporangium sp. AC04546 TaxID=2862460 RepID=UPI001EDD0E4D|nr:hypothetical protein [Dactylosporangium sp. AC04546]WVK79408.1 hypothetical protein KZZ52_36185 [Dactylosporangium sp. AC04546]
MGHLVQPSRGRIPEDLLERALADQPAVASVFHSDRESFKVETSEVLRADEMMARTFSSMTPWSTRAAQRAPVAPAWADDADVGGLAVVAPAAVPEYRHLVVVGGERVQFGGRGAGSVEERYLVDGHGGLLSDGRMSTMSPARQPPEGSRTS